MSERSPQQSERRQSDAEIASRIRWVARAMDYDRRWLRPLRRRTNLPTGRRLAGALVLIVASVGLGMFARSRADGAGEPTLVIASFAYDGAPASRGVAADLRTRLQRHISGTTSLRVSATAPTSGADALRAGGRLVEADGVLTLHLRLDDVQSGREVGSSIVTGDVRRLDDLVDEASRVIVRHVPARSAVRQP